MKSCCENVITMPARDPAVEAFERWTVARAALEAAENPPENIANRFHEAEFELALAVRTSLIGAIAKLRMILDRNPDPEDFDARAVAAALDGLERMTV